MTCCCCCCCCCLQANATKKTAPVLNGLKLFKDLNKGDRKKRTFSDKDDPSITRKRRKLNSDHLGRRPTGKDPNPEETVPGKKWSKGERKNMFSRFLRSRFSSSPTMRVRERCRNLVLRRQRACSSRSNTNRPASKLRIHTDQMCSVQGDDPEEPSFNSKETTRCGSWSDSKKSALKRIGSELKGKMKTKRLKDYNLIDVVKSETTAGVKHAKGRDSFVSVGEVRKSHKICPFGCCCPRCARRATEGRRKTQRRKAKKSEFNRRCAQRRNWGNQPKWNSMQKGSFRWCQWERTRNIREKKWERCSWIVELENQREHKVKGTRKKIKKNRKRRNQRKKTEQGAQDRRWKKRTDWRNEAKWNMEKGLFRCSVCANERETSQERRGPRRCS